MLAPFSGEYSGCAWNSQALFASSASAQKEKQSFAWSLLDKRDFLGLSETHSLEGRIATAVLPSGCQYFWSHGTSSQAGVGLVVKDSFLQQFNEIVRDDDWVEIEPGRMAKLCLRGPHGSLDLIIVVYLASGADSAIRAARHRSISLLDASIADKASVLSITMGDFNFVERNDDRWCNEDKAWTGSRDKKESEDFQNNVCAKHGFHELIQPVLRHRNSAGRSRLDRVYSNHALFDQLDRVYECVALSATTLSAHRPIAFSRKIPKKERRDTPIIPNWIATDPDFGRRVALEFGDLLQKDASATCPFRQLVLVKRAMHATAQGYRQEGVNKNVEGTDDKVGWILGFIRAAEKVNLNRMKVCAKACPTILDYVHHDDPEARSHPNMSRLKNLVVNLSRQDITDSVDELRSLQDGDEQTRTNLKTNILSKLKRLLLGATNTVAAIQREDGSITNDAEEMADEIRRHWSKVFSAPCVDKQLMTSWLASLPQLQGQIDDHASVTRNPDEPLRRRRCARAPVPKECSQWRVRRKDVSMALSNAGNTSPGPDGIPFASWRAIKSLGVDILYNVALGLEHDNAKVKLVDAYRDEASDGSHLYNLSTLVCLPKAPSGEDSELGLFFKPCDIRPLSIVNCDNRLVASAMRIRWEEHLRQFVQEHQQGFLEGRSIIKDLVEVENAMILRSLDSADSAAVFLDFAAAFPSISQEYVMQVLQHIGMPTNALNAFRMLYDTSSCRIALKGATFDGFLMTSGVRQGCPLSPLIYAVIAEALLEKIELEAPGTFVRAYADDTALVMKNFWIAGPHLVEIFQKIELVSGLRLNKSKSLVVPLSAHNFKDFEARKLRDLPAWADMPVKLSCKYLGFQMGPAKKDSSWKAPFSKYLERVNMWQDQPLGLHFDARVYNTFAMPVLCYIAQLEQPPKWVLDCVRDSLKKVAKGPHNWVRHIDLWTLKEAFGLKASFKNLEWNAIAAQVRVCSFDSACLPQGTLQQDCDQIRCAMNNTNESTRFAWADWYANAFCYTLEGALAKITQDAGGIENLRCNRRVQPVALSKDRTWRKDCQGSVYKFYVAVNAMDPVARLREKLARWQLGDKTKFPVMAKFVHQSTPAWQAEACWWRLRCLEQAVPPRVQAAAFGTIWNRWTTSRRFQKRDSGTCLFCSVGEDSIEHYCTCPVVRDICRRRLNLDPDRFASLHSFTLTSPFINTWETLITVSLLIYATYVTTNKLRHKSLGFGREDTFEALNQAIKEGARGHAMACKVLAQRWVDQPVSDSLPAQHLTHFDGVIFRYRQLSRRS